MSGIKGNNSNEVVLKSIDQLTGLANLRVVAINPNKAELEKLLGLEEGKIEKEPQYIGLDLNNDGILKNKIAFHLEGKVLATQKDFTKKEVLLKTRVEFIVADRERVSTTGKKQLINLYGAASWNTQDQVESNDKMKWFNKPPFHNALEGEEILLVFLRNWLNLGGDDACNLADVHKVMAGDVTELRGYMKAYPTNEVTVYLDVTEKNDKYYQNVYNKAFSRPTAKSPETIFANAFKEQYGEPKTPFNGWEVKIFYPKANIDTPDSETPAVKPNAFI